MLVASPWLRSCCATDHRWERDVTVGLDIGTTSVKGLAVDDDGHVLAQVRCRAPDPDAVPTVSHDANRAWRDGVRQAWRQVSSGLHPVGVNVVAMVPSLAAVDATDAR